MSIKRLFKVNIKKVLSDKDERNLLIQILLAFGVKGVSLIISLFSMPLYIKYFNNDEVLGLWYTILSMLSWIHICDLGLGNGLRNRLTEALAKGEEDKAKNYISSTYMAMIGVICPILLIIAAVIWFADLNVFFNISPELISPTTLKISILLLLASVAVSFVLKTVNVIIYAIQKSSYNNVISLIISLLPLVFVALYNGQTMESNLLALTLVHVLSANVPLLLATLVLFSTKKLKKVAPSIKCCTFDTAKSMLGFGMQFFLAQIFFMVITSTNEIMITKMYSAADVVSYSIYYRLFTVVGSLFMLALTPLWSKVTKDLALGNYNKIRITNRVLYVFSALACAAEFMMVFFLQFIVDFWLKEDAITVSYTTALIFAFYGSVYIFNIVLTTVANGMGDLKTQIFFYGASAVLKVPVLLVLSSKVDNFAVVMLYNAVALSVFCLYQLIWVERKLKKLAQQKT